MISFIVSLLSRLRSYLVMLRVICENQKFFCLKPIHKPNRGDEFAYIRERS